MWNDEDERVLKPTQLSSLLLIKPLPYIHLVLL